jgi:hypothetical protein
MGVSGQHHTPADLPPGTKRTLVATTGLVEPTDGLHVFMNSQISYPNWESNPGPSD